MNRMDKRTVHYAGYALLGSVLLASLSLSHAATTQLSTPIMGNHLQGVQRLQLNLPAIAAYTEQPQYLYVVDVSQQVMPMRVEQPWQTERDISFPLQLYRWPSQAVFDNAQTLNQLQLQLKQGAQQAVVTWPSQSMLNLTRTGADQTWLLVTPKLPKQIQPHYLFLTWTGQDISSRVQVEGSDNLIDWQFAGLGQILQTRNANGQTLLQQRIDISQPYQYWRLGFEQPIRLQQASLQARQASMPLWQQQNLTFQHIEDHPQQWQLQLPYKIAVQKMQFNIPVNQLWSVSIEAKINRQGRETWQPVAQSELYHWATAQPGIANISNQIDLNTSVVASAWRLNIQGPVRSPQLDVQIFYPQTELYFLAQGVPPYRLVVDKQGLRSAPQLPKQLNAGAEAYLGETVVQAIPTSTRQYALWLGLILLVSILAIAAWRLSRNLQHASDNELP